MMMQQGVPVKGKDMLWVDTQDAVPVGTTLCFEIKGNSDAMITIRGKPEVDPQDASPDTPSQAHASLSSNEPETQTIPLTVVFGSHRNTKLKICGGKECLLLREDISEALLDPKNFKTFWICFANKCVSLGYGMVHPAGCLLSHPVRVPAHRLFIGFLSLDSPVIFRSIRLTKPLCHPLSRPPPPDGTLASRCLDKLSRGLSPENVCQLLCLLTTTWRTADPVWRRCVTFLAKHFASVAEAAPEAIQSLSADAITEAVAYNGLNASEITIFRVIEAWALGTSMCKSALASDAAPRRPIFLTGDPSLAQAVPDIRQALDHVRFPLMTAAQLQSVSASHLWPLLGGPDAYLSDVAQPRYQSRDAVPQSAAAPWPPQHAAQQCRQGARVCLPQDLRRMWQHQRRTPADAVAELQFVHAGDKNGALYHLGTNGGTNSRFVNPHLTGAVQAVCSSSFSSTSDAGKLTGRVYHGEQCAHANSAGEAFWQVNLQGRAVVCLEYVIRVNDSSAFPRSWVLQGWQDGASWVDLHTVYNSFHFQCKGQYGVWHVEHPIMQPVSSIRLLMLGRASNGSAVLNVNFIELYGYLINDSAARL
eukprot:jgi/Ulvmu1/2636/UM014_0088.1